MRLTTGLILALFTVFLTACTTRHSVPIRQGAPFTSPHRFEERAFVVYPDRLSKDRYSINVGSFPDKNIYKVRPADAYRSEGLSRFRGIFNNGVVLLDQSRLNDILTIETRQQPVTEEGQTELSALLDELENRPAPDAPMTMEDQDERFLSVDNEFIAGQDVRYVILFQEALFGVQEDRPRVIFTVSFIDRVDDERILFTRTYRGAGTLLDLGQNPRLNKDRIAESIRVAFSSPMMQLTEDIAAAVRGNQFSR